MSKSRFQAGVFLLEGMNSFAVTLYFYYFYFFMQKRFGFGDKANLALAAASGLIYVPAALWAGRFAQRAGYFTALKTGFAIMLAALTIGWLVVQSAGGQIVIMLITTAGMCFIWPTLEALVSEGETYTGLQRNVGIYNVVWASTGAAAYFIGGALLDKFGLNSLFFVPIAIQVMQFALVIYLQSVFKSVTHSHVAEAPHPHPRDKAKIFLRMAWLANPFAYIAINTLVAVMPGVATRLGLSTTVAGFCCSLWCFLRLGAFFVLWFWPGWHYRFRWLLVSFIAMICGFTVVLTVSNLAAVMVAEIVFGLAVGLIYYSSLFYSMDVGDTKGEHGGIHEAAIGLGNFIGPAVGAASLQFFPQYTSNGVVAVSVLLVCGLGGLLAIQRTAK